MHVLQAIPIEKMPAKSIVCLPLHTTTHDVCYMQKYNVYSTILHLNNACVNSFLKLCANCQFPICTKIDLDCLYYKKRRAEALLWNFVEMENLPFLQRDFCAFLQLNVTCFCKDLRKFWQRNMCCFATRYLMFNKTNHFGFCNVIFVRF